MIFGVYDCIRLSNVHKESVFPMGKNEKGMVRNESISGIIQGRTFFNIERQS